MGDGARRRERGAGQRGPNGRNPQRQRGRVVGSAALGAPIGVRLGAVALGAAALAGSWLVLRAAVERDGSDARTSYYVGAKGAPGIGVYVKRGARVFAWNGTEAIRAGDLLRLGVAAGNYRFIAVCSRSREGLITLYRGELRGNGELPVAWAVDDAGDAERLIVVLSDRPLSDHEVRAEAAAPRGSSAVWSRELVLPKHAARSGSAGAAP